MNFITTQHDYVLDLLEDIVKSQHQVSTDIITCSTREDFLDEVLALALALEHRHDDERELAPTTQSQDGGNREMLPAERIHMLLTPTLQLLNASRFCNLVFCPTTTVLRGYLASYCPEVASASPAESSSNAVHGRMIILNLLALHHGTSEFTLQGLSQTLATAVSAAHGAKRRLELVECKDARDPSNPSRGPMLWQADVQLLSAAIKIGEGGSSWGRRSISVMTLASRWFRIRHAVSANEQVRPELRRHKRVKSEDEMLV
ncbi:hypothetical protein A1O1_02924 [Capronia coronata CBS 617.96]|uniref:Uncharacterized protein n=1 Tax=Capronia coronata CBS 617.96 TaxID=1182541 RepID=W9YPQ0_9EURO|nr:uncharacterized protein A1O1_02924 [Capronia coronata CBS 617.96]EXJ94528.1 hypothetical protein A1O1_02924 [Capronia coronata CBS 617.96]